MKLKFLLAALLALAVFLAPRLEVVTPQGQALQAAPPTKPATEPARRIIAEGRVAAYPGAEITLSSELPAVILRLPVKEKDRVRKGDLIAELKAEDLKAQGEQAKSLIAETEANIRLLDLEIERLSKLWESRQAPKQELDRYLWQREAQRALRESRIADAHRLLAILAKTQITAPIDGIVTQRNADPGEMMALGMPIATLVDLGKLRVEADLDEFDAGRVRLGDPVTVTAEGYPGKALQAVVEEIPDSVVGRRLKPQDPARPVDTRVLLVKIAFREAFPFKLGQRVDLEIFTSGR